MSYVFNVFTSNFDEVSDLTVTVGASPNANASTTVQTGTAISLTLQPANTSFPGVLLAADWNTFNNKQPAGNYITALTGDGTATGPGSVAFTLATVNGNVGTFGTATQVSTFTVNGKGLITAASNTSIQIAESQVTNLVTDLAAKQSTTLTNTHILVGNGSNVATDVAASGDLTLANTGAFTLNTVNGNVGTFGTATQTSTFTVNAKGLITAASNTSIQITEAQVTNLTTDLAAKQSTTLTNTHILVGNGSNVATDVALSGDATLANTGALTLATVNGNVGSFGSSTSIPSFTVNAKGLITAASGNAVIAPAGTLTGTTLASNVVSSSLTSVGTITSGTWNGTTIAIANGGTGQTSKSAAFDALSPMTTGGDLIYGGASGTGTRLANGSAGQFLKSNGTTLAPTWASPTITLTAPTQQRFTSGIAQTYTTPANVLYIRVRMVGAGGGGGGSGSSTSGHDGGTSANHTLFGTSLLDCAPGNGGSGTTGLGGSGGAASIAGPAYGTSVNGGNGTSSDGIVNIKSGSGASTSFGGAGGGTISVAGVAGVANSGSGGSGGGGSGTAFAGAGGGAGGFIDAIIPSPSATYSYTIGAGGTAGSAGTGGFVGGAGGSGYIEVTEYYQ